MIDKVPYEEQVEDLLQMAKATDEKNSQSLDDMIKFYEAKDLWQGLGLLVMIVMLFSRIGIELYQNNRLKTIDPTTDFKNYLLNHKAYFKSRKRIHFILTPVIYFVYFGGFASMLSAFKASLSSGFYTYIVISGSLTFVALAVFIGYHI